MKTEDTHEQNEVNNERSEIFIRPPAFNSSVQPTRHERASLVSCVGDPLNVSKSKLCNAAP